MKDYRAWDKKTKQMCKVLVIDFHNEKVQISIPSGKNGYKCFVAQYRKFDEIILMEYTGLTDDNKIKIFDGDILHLADSHNEIQAVIEFGNPNGLYSWGWQLRQIKGVAVNLDILLWIETECDAVWCEVIGNIHEEVTE